MDTNTISNSNKKSKFYVGDVVWIIRNGVARPGQIRAAKYYDYRIFYSIYVSGENYSTEFEENDVYTSADDAIASELKRRRYVIEQELKRLKIDNDKIKRGLDIIFSEDENELDNEDFKELPQSDETLAIPEHTSFWKSIWEGSKAVWEGK